MANFYKKQNKQLQKHVKNFKKYIYKQFKWLYLNLIKKKSTDQSKPIYLNKVETNKIIISDEFKLDDGVKKIIGYKNG